MGSKLGFKIKTLRLKAQAAKHLYESCPDLTLESKLIVCVYKLLFVSEKYIFFQLATLKDMGIRMKG